MKKVKLKCMIKTLVEAMDQVVLGMQEMLDPNSYTTFLMGLKVINPPDLISRITILVCLLNLMPTT